MKIGIYGGSFNPIHKGHIHVARAAIEQANLDLLYLMPSYLSPNKLSCSLCSPEHRIAMCEIAASDDPRILVSDFEATNKQISYTYLTLQELHSRHPEDELYFVMGADSLDYLEDWCHPEIICNLATILVVDREGFSMCEMQRKIDHISALYHASLHLLDAPRFNASSTQIKRMLKENKEKCPLELDERIYQYICANHLYEE